MSGDSRPFEDGAQRRPGPPAEPSSHEPPVDDRSLDGSSSLSLDQLDRAIVEAADPHWSHGNYVAAVRDSATAAFAILQQRTGIYNLSEGDLVNQVFSDQAKSAGQVRLKFPAGSRSQTRRSREDGAKSLGFACFQGVHSIVTHERDLEWGRQDCLEYLVLFSVFVRWIRDCEIER